jgi:ubiquinone/menaquinone biosynthesis C-methylase UbiE
MEIFFEIHKDIPREGPGDNKSTRKAFKMLKKLPKNSKILDVGCGPGMQTIELAKNTDGIIYALDNHDKFLDHLKNKAKKENLDNKIQMISGSMFTLDKYFKKEELDLIWAEGSIYIIGFKEGIENWKPFLKKGGYLVASEISWLKDNIPKEIKEYWGFEYPNMKNIENNLDVIKKCGYKIIDHFTIPESSWFDNYYDPLEERVSNLYKINKGNKEWEEAINMQIEEIEMYRKYSEYYGYVFYIMQKA